MPEGPEVKRIVDQMSVHLGRQIAQIDFLSGRYTKKEPDGFSEFQKEMKSESLIIQEVRCKGKFIYFTTNTDWTIWNTLGMSGGWSPNQDHNHARVKFTFSDDFMICFNDTRNFGTLKFVNSKEGLKKKLDSLGLDVLDEVVPFEKFHGRLMHHKMKTLPEILMDQKLFSGIGNYIKAEALYLAKLSPHRKAYTLSDAEVELLRRAVHSIIRESYRSGGSTLRTYSDFNGTPGTFADRFMVYGQKKDPEGNPVIKEQTKDKRTTHWVPRIQK